MIFDLVLRTVISALAGAFAGLLITVISYGPKKVVREKKEEKQNDILFRDCLCSLLRNDIVCYYERYVEHRGYCPLEFKFIIENTFKNYQALGGNGTGKKMYEEIMDLPTEPEQDVKKEKAV